MKLKYYFFYSLCLLGISLQSCDDCTFTSRNHTKVRVRFYERGKKNPLEISFFRVLTGANVSITNTPQQITVSSNASLTLPLHPYQDESQFIFQTTATSQDSITLQYQRNFLVVSPDCGYDQQITNLKIKSSSFDSVALFKPDLTIDDTVNVRIYIR